MFLAGKTVAGTVLDLLTVDGELDKAKAEFYERTGGGSVVTDGWRRSCHAISSHRSICAGRST